MYIPNLVLTFSFIDSIVTCMSDCRRGLDWWLDLCEHLHTKLVTTSNYNAIAHLHTLQITTAHAKASQSVFTSRFLVTDPNNILCWCQYRPTNIPQLTHCQSQSYVTTDGQSASLSWNKAPIWGLRPDLYYCLTVAGLLTWGALSDERKVSVICHSHSQK
jgi:hypothetical protein